jgi:SAM-dependent methyltransferase
VVPTHDDLASGLRSIRALAAVPAVETALFVATRAPRGAHVLEVGCGTGELALLLGRVGFRVTALDCADEAVRAARAKGVEVHAARWPDFEGGPFDAVLFSRSLHHIDNLDAALDQARKLVAPTGLLLVEDFAREAFEQRSALWVCEGLQRCGRAGLLEPRDTFVADALAAGDASAVVAAWRGRHGDDLHPSLALEAAIRRAFGDVQATSVPYLYRYLAEALARNRRGFLALREWLACEQAAIGDGTIEPVGRRYVARPR